MTDTMRGNGADQVTIDDNVIVTGFFNSNKSWGSISGNIKLLDTTAKCIYICIYIYIYWNDTGVAAPRFTTRSLWTKLMLYPLITTTSTDYAIGVEKRYMWYSSASTLAGHRWYGCVSRVLDITITGVLASGRIYNYQTTQTA